MTIFNVVVAVERRNPQAAAFQRGGDLLGHLPVGLERIEAGVGKCQVAEHVRKAVGLHPGGRFRDGQLAVNVGTHSEAQIPPGLGAQVVRWRPADHRIEQGDRRQTRGGLQPIATVRGNGT
jgi:hypothetical protein